MKCALSIIAHHNSIYFMIHLIECVLNKVLLSFKLSYQLHFMRAFNYDKNVEIE